MSISHPPLAFLNASGSDATKMERVIGAPAGTATMRLGGRNPTMLAVRLIGVLALVALNGFFAATEFSLVAVRLSRIRQLVAKGNARARIVEALLGDLHRVVSGVQLGITLTSLADWRPRRGHPCKVISAIWPATFGAHTTLVTHAIALTCAFALLSCAARSHRGTGSQDHQPGPCRAAWHCWWRCLPLVLGTFRWAIHLLDRISGAIVKLGSYFRAGSRCCAFHEELPNSDSASPVNAA